MNPFARKPAESVPVDIYDPATGEKVGISIRVAGRDSEVAKAVERAQMDRRFERAAVTGAFQAPKAEEIAREQVERVVACTRYWEGVDDENGAPLACTPENVKRLYTECPWICDQVQRAVDNRALFFAPPPSNSSPSPNTSSGSPA